MTLHVALLMGGLSPEREVSLRSGRDVEKALRELGHRVTVVDVGRDLAQRLAEVAPDVAFNALHGQLGEDGAVQGVLELLGIPYTHSGVLASALAMDKPTAKRVFQSVGLRCAEGTTLPVGAVVAAPPFEFPIVVKEPGNGSSVGVYILHGSQELEQLKSLDPATPMLVERFVPGREIQVAVLDDAHGVPHALGAIEIRPLGGFYDYEAKYTAGRAEHLMPAPLAESDYAEVCRLAVRAHAALGCRGLTRSDFRFDDTGLGEPLFYLLEVNTQPGMTPLSLSPEIAAHAGIGFTELVRRVLAAARLGG